MVQEVQPTPDHVAELNKCISQFESLSRTKVVAVVHFAAHRPFGGMAYLSVHLWAQENIANSCGAYDIFYRDGYIEFTRDCDVRVR